MVNFVNSPERAICLFVITFHACNILSEMLTLANDLSNIKVFKVCVSTVVSCLFYYLKVIGNIQSGNSRLSP